MSAWLERTTRCGFVSAQADFARDGRPPLRSWGPAPLLEGSPMRGSNSLIARGGTVASALALLVGGAAVAGSVPAVAQTTHVAPNKVGGLDCNGFSPIQRTGKRNGLCTHSKGY